MADIHIERWATPRTTVVTGANGWLGRALVHRLLADPTRPRLRLLAATTAESDALRSFVGPRARSGGNANGNGNGNGNGEGGGGRGSDVEIIIGDVSRADTARRLLHDLGPDTDVLHTAGIIHPKRVRQFFEVNTNGTRNVSEASLDAGVRRMVLVSSNSPFGTNPDPADTFRADEPYNPYLGYGRSKMMGELAALEAHAAGLDVTIVRPPWFYGPFQPPRQTTFFRMVRKGKFPVIGKGDQRRSMVYVDNLVDGILAAELTPGAKGNGYWIADARAYTVSEIVETVGRALVDEGLSVAPPTTRVPAVAARVAELADRTLQAAGLYQQQLHVLGEMGHTIACDISASTAALGYVPAVDLYEGMRRSIRWCIDQGLQL